MNASCKFCHDDITVMSFININMVTLLLKASCKEQHSDLYFLCLRGQCKRHSLSDAVN